MAYKDIVVFVDPSPAGMQRLRIAAGLARRYAAHLIGVYVVPGDMDDRASDGFVRGERGVKAVLERHRAAEERAVVQVGRQFADIVVHDDIHAEFRLIWNTDGDRGVVLNSLYADLAVAGQAAPNGLPQSWLPRHLLLASGVPMLVVPDSWTASEATGERVLIAWNASKEARRAIADALPLLSNARSVRIVVIDATKTPDRHGQEPGADIALHLARHGAPVEVEQLASNGASVAETILGAVGRNQADLVVMGAHGHSRSRQLLFGSVTQAILENATVPVLLSH
jgi:nucleotide-binding universal stress UspA family protein